MADLWGTGTPLREFLHVDDLASACTYVMSLDAAAYSGVGWPIYAHFNVGTGSDVTILLLAETLCEIIGYRGTIKWDKNMPDGTPRKLLDSSRLRSLGWSHTVRLREGLESTVRWFLENRAITRR